MSQSVSKAYYLLLSQRLIAQAINHDLLDLLEICGQRAMVPLETLVNEAELTKKLGEGSYSEVFLKHSANGSTNVLKIVPFGGDKQTTCKDILSEIRITK